MIEKIKNFIFKHEKVEEVLFWGILILVGFAAFISTIFTAVEGFGVNATLFCALCCAIFAAIGIIAKLTHSYSGCYFLLVFTTNIICLAPLFFFCGGFSSGIILYCMAGVFIAILHPNKILRVILVLSSLAVYEAIFIIAFYYPTLCTQIEPKSAFIDIATSFFLMSITICAVTAYLIRIYQLEREKKQKLIEKLDFIAIHDQLTNLYNRRYFIKFLESIIWNNKNNYFILMYDIDNFKAVNDKYGHPFGDIVLSEIANIAQKETCQALGELTVRYGGEEFIQVIRADNIIVAEKRANQLRESIAKLSFEKYPEVRVTISGGLVDCNDEKFTHQNKMLSFVDGLLYLAKKYGKNRIIVNP